VEVQVDIGVGLVKGISVDGKRTSLRMDLTTNPLPVIIGELGESRQDDRKREPTMRYQEYYQRLLNHVRSRELGEKDGVSEKDAAVWRTEAKKLQEQLLYIDLENDTLKHCNKKRGGGTSWFSSTRLDVENDEPLFLAGTGVVCVARLGWQGLGNQDSSDTRTCYLEEWEYHYTVIMAPLSPYTYELIDGYPILKKRSS
jgi:hypothetical protein